MNVPTIVNLALGLVLAPLMLGVINRTKAIFGGRTGQPLLQQYYDLVKLLRKGAVYSTTTSWVFRAGPIVGLAAALGALALVPFGGRPGLLSFSGDVLLFAYVLGLGRFLTILAALDTGSPFEGMGASREATYGALAEPALLVGLAAFAHKAGGWSLAAILSGAWSPAPGAETALVAIAVFVVLLCENARIPFDDPNTHLELTMIHEVMVLDHSGPDFAYITYGAAVKLWALTAILVGILVPPIGGEPWVATIVAVAGQLVVAVVVGTVESTMARLRLVRLPSLLAGAASLSALAMLLVLR